MEGSPRFVTTCWSVVLAAQSSREGKARVALEEVQRSLPDFEVDEAGIRRIHSVNVRGFASLPIEFST